MSFAGHAQSSQVDGMVDKAGIEAIMDMNSSGMFRQVNTDNAMA